MNHFESVVFILTISCFVVILTEEIKPIAIVFPQYHPIPENDLFWGVNFTEWTLLKPYQRKVNGYVIRKPHPDIGYYDFLDYDHRRYMRILANHFGIYGFCFYHYWFANRPVMSKVAEMMLKDGEPNTPFFFCWANEQWNRRQANGTLETLLLQDYSNRTGNIDHFMYLLPFFQHKSYIRVNDRPVFSFYRIGSADQKPLAAVMALWQELALKHGLPGIHFVRFQGPFNNDVVLDDIRGVIEFEPGYSWQRIHCNRGSRYDYSINARVPCQISHFKVYDGVKTLQMIESREFSQSEYYRGTAISWNNAPRLNFTKSNYDNYPHYIEPISSDMFKDHFGRLVDKTLSNKVSNKFIFLTAWNEWNEQSIFEPNDVDGYSALLSVRRVVHAKNLPVGRGQIFHVSHFGGGTEKYIRDLMLLFDDYDHQYFPSRTLLPETPPWDLSLLHVHSVMIGKDSIGWKIVGIVDAYRARNASAFVTVHDYQWLFPENPHPTLEYLLSATPRSYDIEMTRRLFNSSSRVIFPSNFVFQQYVRFLSKSNKSLAVSNWVIVAHCDSLVSHSYISIPAIEEQTIHIGFIGLFTSYKGSNLFGELASKYQRFVLNDHEYLNLRYHVFGKDMFDQSCRSPECLHEARHRRHIQFHGYYKNHEILSILQKSKIHILFVVSTFPETYSYAFTVAMNSGLPVVYLSRGSLEERVQAARQTLRPQLAAARKYFGANNESVIKQSIMRAVQFAVTFSGKQSGFRPSTQKTQPNRWYISHYPVDAL